MKKIVLVFSLLLLSCFSFSQQDSTIRGVILDGVSISYYIAMLFFAYLGMIVNILSDITRRNPESANSPKKFKLDYWWSDNKIRILVSIFMVIVAVLLCNSLVGIELNKMNSFIIGFGSDHILEIIKRKSSIMNQTQE